MFFVKFSRPRWLAWLLLSFVLAGCGSSENYVYTGPPVTQGAEQALLVDLQVAPADQVAARISSEATRFEVTLYDSSLNQVASASVSPSEDPVFGGLEPGRYLVRVVGYRSGGGLLGYFDRVVDFPAERAVIIDALRYVTAAPPAVVFPAEDAQGFLTFSSPPTLVEQGDTFSLTVKAYDASGRPDTNASSSVTLSAGEPTFTSAPPTVALSNGQASFSNLTLEDVDDATAVVFTAAAPGFQSGQSPSAVFLQSGQVAALAFVSHPTSVLVDDILSPPVQVEVLDADGDRVTDPVAVTIALTGLGNPPADGFLSGTKTVTTVNGVATFNNLSIDAQGTYRLTATAAGYQPAQSSTVTVSPPSGAAQLVFLQYPAQGFAGTPLMGSAVRIAVEDAQGDPVTEPVEVTLSLTPLEGSPATAQLLGPLTVTSVNGEATFNFVTIDQAGTYQLNATASGYQTGTTQEDFPIVIQEPAPATRLVESFNSNSVLRTYNVGSLVTGQNDLTALFTFGNATNTGQPLYLEAAQAQGPMWVTQRRPTLWPTSPTCCRTEARPPASGFLRVGRTTTTRSPMVRLITC